MRRNPLSHKGENGKVAVIGGSSLIHGAPLFSALAAEASGVDLVFVSLPKIHAEIARSASLNFQILPFNGDELEQKDVTPLLELLATMDSAIIGPGLDRSQASLAALERLITSAPCTLVLDASALQPWTLSATKGKEAVLTPHLGELERMGLSLEDIGHTAKTYGVTIHVKGPIDHIAVKDGTIIRISGGNAGLTVGGTGDALAGLIGGLLAQGVQAADACTQASDIIKHASDELLPEKGYAYTTMDVIERIPRLLHREQVG